MLDEARRLKILHVIPSVAACRGGPSKAVVEMVTSLNELGHTAEIATTNDNGIAELDVPLNTLINYNHAPIRFFKRVSPPINAIREFAYSYGFSRWLSKNIANYDLVHVHAIFSYCSSYSMFLARRRGIPYVVRPIGQLQQWSLDQSRTKKDYYLGIIEKKNLESAAAVHFTADIEKQEAEVNFKLLGQVIPLGIHPPEKAKLSKVELLKQFKIAPSKITILYLSRLHPKKGLELLLEALARFKSTDFRLVIAGDGEQDYTRHLKSLCKGLSLNHKCHFIGQVAGDQKTALLQYSDLFALTSHSENFGISVLEAMSFGLTPLISNEVALSDAIKKNELGLVCTTQVDSIEDKLRFAFEQMDEISLMGRKAKQYSASYFSWPVIAGELSKLYRSIS